MLIDMHMHEMTFSKDSFLKLDEMVRIAKEKGLDAICITDHDSMGLKDYAAEYTKATGFPVFVGIEYFSLLRHMAVTGSQCEKSQFFRILCRLIARLYRSASI